MKTCPKCKEQLAPSAKTCPKCGYSFGLPIFVKVIIILIVIFGCLFGCVYGCTKTVSEAVNDSVKEVKNDYNDVNGKTSFKINESFENKYEKITMIEVNTNVTDYNSYFGPKAGNKIIAIKFEFENISSNNDELYVSTYGFNAYADGVAVSSYFYGGDKYKDLSATVGKGKKAVGYVLYEVPIDSKKITVEYNANFWVDGNTIEFIVQE